MQRYNYEIEYLIDDVKEEYNYLSETKKEVLNNVKGNYPQLCTYESEWIYFDETGYIAGEPVEVEYQTVEGTNGTVENAIPFHYKSAILKGNTIKKIGLEIGSYNGYLDKIPMNNRIRTTETVKGYNTIKIVCKDGYQAFIRTVGKDSSWNQSLSFELESESESSFVVLFKKNDDSVFSQSDYGNIIEYTNIAEISDNNGNELVSVQKPVLTTTGKNLFNVGTVKKGYTLSSNNGLETINPKRYTTDFIYVKGITHLAITNPERTLNIWGYDENKQPIIKIKSSGDNGNFTVSIPSNITYIRMPFSTIDQSDITDDFIQNNLVQMEVGKQFTSYEPYKSNILTVNEKIELRGIGEVKDELDLLTGKTTERIGEIVLDGSEDWTMEDGNRCYLPLPNLIRSNNYIGRIICDGDYIISSHNIDMIKHNKPTLTGYIDNTNLYPNDNWLYIYIPSITTVQALKEHLSQNPITVQYELKTESVKTVDLTSICRPFEGVNHFTTSSDTIAPNMTLQVPVVSTGEQTLQEINK